MCVHAYGIRSSWLRIVEMVLPASILGGHMATVTECIPLDKYFTAVWFMTILAHDSGLVHFSLEKGGIYINLIQDLSVGKIESFLKERWPVGIQERTSVIVVFCGNCPA
jgi:hypothetical protein